MSGDAPSDTLHPPVLWAQRNDCLYVTIALGDVKDKVLKLDEESLSFSGRSGSPKPQNYAVRLVFYGQVNPEESRQMSTDREIVYCIKKKEPSMWPRLLSSSTKYTWLKIDFHRWVDPDQSDEEFGNDNFSEILKNVQRDQLLNYGNLDDAGSDAASDDDLPDLEAPEPEGKVDE